MMIYKKDKENSMKCLEHVTKKSKFKDKDIEARELWARYKEDPGNISYRNALIEHYREYINIHADRIMSNNSHHDFDTLVSWGFDGLLQAIDKYEPESGNSFYTYGYSRVWGSIVDGMRTTMKRYHHKQTKVFESTRRKMESEIGLPVYDEEVAERMGISYEKWVMLKNTYTSTDMIPLDNSRNSEKDIISKNMLVCKQKGPEHQSVEIEQFENYIKDLDDKCKDCMRMIYIDGLTYAETARRMKVSQPHVSTLHHRSLFLIADKLGVPTPANEQLRKNRVMLRKDKTIKDNPSNFRKVNKVGKKVELECSRCSVKMEHITRIGCPPKYCDSCRGQIYRDRVNKVLVTGAVVPKITGKQEIKNEERSGH
jgi:RNA polymerase sigma factor for flagellar operon FliA